MPGRINQGKNWLQTIPYKGDNIAADAMACALLKATLWTTGTVYAAGAITYVGSRGGSNDNVYVCTTGGTAGATTPTGTGTGISDGACVWAHMASATYAQITAGSAEPSGGSYTRKTITSASATISAAGVMTHSPALQWGTGVTTITGCELWLIVAKGTAAYGWGWLSASRTLTTNDTMTESITDTL